MYKQFRCVDGCSDCCISRQYFPSVKYGKIGVMLLSEEKSRIEDCARKNDLEVKILPRIGIGKNRLGNGPEKILIHQIMGTDTRGDVCPFLDTEGDAKAPNGGYRCKIYEERPLACRAYPINQIASNKELVLDAKCQFCKANSCQVERSSLTKEFAALKTVKRQVRISTNTPVWRYATHIGEKTDSAQFLPEGWILENK
jgi:Fe-S-cluster containining protein